MNQYVKQKWITALRSGEYKQTNHQWYEEEGRYMYSSDGCTVEATLPDSVMKWAQLEECNPTVREDSMGQPITTLAYLNDREALNFNQLADIIEAQL